MPPSIGPSMKMKRASLSMLPPPSSSTFWLAPASLGFQRVKPYCATSDVTHLLPVYFVTWNLPL